MAGQVSLGEFDMIARYLAPLAAEVPGAFGLTDDAAIFALPPGHDAVVSSDAMVEGVHFLATDGARRIARKLLRVNISDLAAKGARPLGYQLILGLPGPLDETWLAAFCGGLAEDQAAFGMPLYGGDTVRSPAGIVLGVTAFGTVPAGTMIRRAGAQVGDDLYVTGSIGDAALGLEVKLNHRLFSSAATLFFDARLHLPIPRLGFGLGLRTLASAALDVSDGLVQDAGHLARASGLSAVITVASVPLSIAARQALTEDPDLASKILTGGDDYELLFTAPASLRGDIAALSAVQGLAVTRIGHMAVGQGVITLDAGGRPFDPGVGGFQHFRNAVE